MQEEESNLNGLPIPNSSLSREQLKFTSVQRSNSSPSLLSSSGENLDPRDSQSEIVVIDNLIADRKEEIIHDKSDGSLLSSKLQQPEDLSINPLSRQDRVASPASPSPSSESSSLHDEVKELPDFRKARGHTISVVQSGREGLRSAARSSNKDSGRGGISPSFVFLQLYYDGVFNSATSNASAPIIIPQNEVSRCCLLIL